jgi:hypothetical protein
VLGKPVTVSAESHSGARIEDVSNSYFIVVAVQNVFNELLICSGHLPDITHVGGSHSLLLKILAFALYTTYKSAESTGFEK